MKFLKSLVFSLFVAVFLTGCVQRVIKPIVIICPTKNHTPLEAGLYEMGWMECWNSYTEWEVDIREIGPMLRCLPGDEYDFVVEGWNDCKKMLLELESRFSRKELEGLTIDDLLKVEKQNNRVESKKSADDSGGKN